MTKRLPPQRKHLLLPSSYLVHTTAISLPRLFRGREIACSEGKKLRLRCRVDQTPRQIKNDLACRLSRPWVWQHRIIMGLKKVLEENIQPLHRWFWGKGGFLGSHHYFVTILRTISFVTASFRAAFQGIHITHNPKFVNYGNYVFLHFFKNRLSELQVKLFLEFTPRFRYRRSIGVKK